VEFAHSIQSDFPIIANGGIETNDCIDKVLQKTTASAIMSSEALLETPSLFSSSQQQELLLPFRFSKEYIELCSNYPPLPGAAGDTHGSIDIVRRHLGQFLHRYIQHYPDLRERLSSKEMTTLQDAKGIIHDLEQRVVFNNNNNYDNTNDNNLQKIKKYWSSPSSPSWYRRHWNGYSKTRENKIEEFKTVEQRKQEILSRIQKLQEQKLARN